MSHIAIKSGEVPRHESSERVTHWIVALTFLLLAASGLAFFHPAFWFLTSLLGGGPWAKILHPFIGVVMFVFFASLALRNWNDNKIQPHDLEWKKRLSDIINNRDDNLPEADKYNFGQKRAFWVMVFSVGFLLLSGIVLWRPYFAPLFPITLIRIASVVHALSAFVLILAFIVHLYSAVFWVKGALRGMTRGTVTHAWARHHHGLWYRRITGNAK